MNKRFFVQIFGIIFLLYSVCYPFFIDTNLVKHPLTFDRSIYVSPASQPVDGLRNKAVSSNISAKTPSPSSPAKNVVTELEEELTKIKVVVNKLPQNINEEYFTIQVLSSRSLKDAERIFRKLSKQLPQDKNEFLRIEKIHNYNTVRVGKFHSKKNALALLEKILNIIPDACLLSAYVKPDRIIKIISSMNPDQKEPGDIVISGLARRQPGKEVKIDAVDKGSAAKGVDIISTEALMKLSSLKLSSRMSDKSINQESLEQPIVKSEEIINSFEEKAGTQIDNNIDDNAKEIEVGDGSPGKISRKKGVRDSIATKYSLEVIAVLEKDDQNSTLRMPSSLFYDDHTEELYVLNSNERRFVVFGSDYFPQNSLGAGRGIYTPTAGAVDSKGRVYILQGSTKGVDAKLTILNKAYLIEKEYSLKVGKEELPFSPNRVSVSAENKVYIVGSNETRIMVFDENGVRQNWFQIKVDKGGNYQSNDKETEFDYAKIIDVTIGNSGNLYFTSERLGKIFVFDQKEKFLFSFGRKGGAKGKLSRPKGLAIDEKQRCIYVIDYMRHALVAYDFQGKFRFEHGGRGWGEGWFNFPIDVEVGKQGQVIVSDYFNNRVQVFKIKVLDILPGGDKGSLVK